MTAQLTCLDGDGGDHLTGAGGNNFDHDSVCKNGFGALNSGGAAIWPAGLNQFRTYQGYGGITDQDDELPTATTTDSRPDSASRTRWGFSGELDYT